MSQTPVAINLDESSGTTTPTRTRNTGNVTYRRTVEQLARL